MAHQYSQPYQGSPFSFADPNSQLRPSSLDMLLQDGHDSDRDASQKQPIFPGPNTALPDQYAQQPLLPPVWPFPPEPQSWSPFYHNGAFPGFPAQGLPFSLPPPPPLTQQPPPFMAFQQTVLQQPLLPIKDRVTQVMDSDREEGECSDGEILPQQHLLKVNGQPQPKPPRSAPQALQTSSASRPAVVSQIQIDRDNAKQFIKLLNSNNIGYQALAKENLDIELLKDLYQSLNLPSEPSTSVPSRAKSSADDDRIVSGAVNSKAPSAAQVVPIKAKPTSNAATNDVPAPSSSSSTTSVVGDRKNYIARLQAAKKAKLSGSTNGNDTPQVKETMVATLAPASNRSLLKAPVTDEQRARNAALIKQRIEAMKERQKTQATSMRTISPRGVAGNDVEPSSFPTIPGLHITNALPRNDSSKTVSNQSSSIPRKRSAQSNINLPTSQAVANPSINSDLTNGELEEVEVDDEESEGSDMEIDNEGLLSNSISVLPILSQSLRSSPSRSASARYTSVTSTPVPQTSLTIAPLKDLKGTEDKLAALRLKIKKEMAEKREKDRAAAAKAIPHAGPPRTRSPSATSQLAKPAQVLPLTPVANMVVASSLNENESTLMDAARPSKRARRSEIEQQLPSLNAEYDTNSSRIAQLSRELDKLKQKNEMITREKEDLTHELEAMGVDTEGMSHKELRAIKDMVDYEKVLDIETDLSNTIVAIDQVSHARQHTPRGEKASSHTTVGLGPITAPWSPQDRVGSLGFNLPGLEKVAPLLMPGSAQATGTHHGATGSSLHSLNAEEEESRDDFDGARAQQPRRINSIAAFTTRSPSTTLDEDEDFYSPEPYSTNIAQPKPSQPIFSGATSLSPEVDSEDANLPEQVEEVYEPEDSLISIVCPEKPSELTNLQTTISTVANDTPINEEEIYEPPEIDAEEAESDGENMVSDYSPKLSQDEGENHAMDVISSPASESSQDPMENSPLSPEPEVTQSISVHNTLRSDVEPTDHIAQQEMPDMLPAITIPEIITEKSDEHDVVQFKPYESPLRRFKSYRYHPNFGQDVAGGYLSLTFSHQIDANNPLCFNEVMDGLCGDPDCSHQHFHNMNISGEKLLVQLGTANPGKTREEKKRWNEGLRSLLQDLRARSVKDPNGIALEIANYRRRFLNDDTRVVNL